MKPFMQLTDGEVLNLSTEEINDAIRLEAIDRGVKPPVTLSEALRKSEWVGYTKPAEHIRVFRIRCGYNASEFAWLDEAKATAALEGMVKLEGVNYSRENLRITTEVPTMETVYVCVGKPESKASKFEEFFEDSTEFDKIADECIARHGALRQADYNKRVNSEKRAEYLRLAGGNEDVAKAFWAKTERTEWPLF